MEYDYDLICVGSGPAGQRCAIQAAKLGKRVAIIEASSTVGGVCLGTGTIPSKTFREAVRAFNTRRSYDSGLGFDPRIKPSAKELLSRVDDVIRIEGDVQIDQLQRNDVNVILGTAIFDGPHSLTIQTKSGAKSLSTDKILIAVGTVPADPPGIKPDGRTVIVSSDVMELTSLPRTLTVVGAGVIGVEYASMFGNLGIEVTIVDGRARPLEFLDGEIIDELIYQMRKKRTTFRLGEKVESVEILADGEGMIRLESGKKIVSEMILFTVGRQGATDGLELQAVGLKADERGRIKVDSIFRTEVDNIYAAGDVIGFPSLAATSAEQGRLAACHMFGVSTGPMPDHFPIGIYSIPEISMVGQTEEQLTDRKIPYETGVALYNEIARGHILGDQGGLLKLIFHSETLRLLGAHVIGDRATEIIHVGQAVLGLGAGLDYFLETVFNYPTLGECYKVAALNAANKLRRSADR